MKKRSITLIIGLMSFALLGVMAMQLYFLRQSYQMQSDLFDRSVNDALNNVVSKLAKQDAINFLNRKAQVFDNEDKPTNSHIGHRTFVSNREDNGLRPQLNKPVKKPMSSRERRLSLLRDSLRQVIASNKLEDELFNMAQSGELALHIRYEEYTDEFGNTHQRMTDPKIVRGPANPVLKKKHTKLHKYDTLYVD
jgi:two-component system phosphate regulon sensor histidine kinase PhoR